MIRKHLNAAYNRQQSYADSKRKHIEFNVGDYMFLKVLLMREIMRLGKKGKLSPTYIGPFKILERLGEVAYKLVLPPDFSGVHPVFYVSMLKRYVSDLLHVIEP